MKMNRRYYGILAVCAAAFVAANAGCTPGDRMANAFANGAAAAGGAISRQMALQNTQASVSGNGVEPGFEAYYKVETAVGTRVAGVAGQFNLSGTGTGGGTTTPEELAATLDAMTDSDLRRLSRLLQERLRVP